MTVSVWFRGVFAFRPRPEATGNDAVHVGRLDLADKASIAAFTSTWTGPLHILVNNAGVMVLPTLERTPDGWELQFPANQRQGLLRAGRDEDARRRREHRRLQRRHRRRPLASGLVIGTGLGLAGTAWIGAAFGVARLGSVLLDRHLTRRHEAGPWRLTEFLTEIPEPRPGRRGNRARSSRV
ncbi:Rossmann-fold NAD(P)-binding domain-containing protein [Streptomyces sasae]|uniref:hypothetical protein n=1 Tax=Streptomyces sasae TaxID=1266772 RepID=UPI0037443873